VTPTPTILIREVSKTYESSKGSVAALRHVSLSVAQNEFVSVIGPTGCGKTTLLNVVAGLVEPDEGHVLVAGRPIDGPAPDRVAIVFQNFALLPWETALGNVLFALHGRGLARAEMLARARDALSRVGLEGFESRHPHELSGGMQQRVGLARALAVSTEVLLMDEPFGSVDAQTRRVLQEDLLRICQEQHKTVLFITHAMDEAVYLSDRVVVMKSRPARVHDILDVPFARPRDADLVQRDPAFLECQTVIWQMLSESARASEFAADGQD
jgi:ABC-type nitrate/sulfonate/bicarbonate transport system ATPase subunit